MCLGSRGDQYWALFWARWWCPSPFPPCFHTVRSAPAISLRGGRHGPESRKQSGRPMGDEMSRRSHLPSGCEATTCRARISRGGGGRVSVMTMEPGA